MSIEAFIQQNTLLPRLKKSNVLVVYDPERIYHNLCLAMATDIIQVVDAGQSSIVAREEAIMALKELGRPHTQLEGLLVYVPARAPQSDEDRQLDPYALYAACGSMFPDGAGDAYLHLCLKAKPDQASEIRRIFSQDPTPSFAVIDAVGTGKGWPNLEVALQVQSASDILFALLAPTDRQKQSLKNTDGWVTEARELFASCLGLRLITRGKTWSSIADELWRFVVYSEFVFDLPGPLPESLANVPRAGGAARPIVEDLCDRLRHDQRTQTAYVQRAQVIEQDLDLPHHCQGIEDLGVRDTFPFEEKVFFHKCIAAIANNETDTARRILKKQHGNVWIGIGESQAQWGLAGAALALCGACDDYERQLPDHSQDMDRLIDFYVGSLREVDRLQREFEQSVVDTMVSDSLMQEVVEKTRTRYRQLCARVQDLFVRHMEKSGWPPLGRFFNADLFDTHISPKLKESGHKVAFFMIDSLRYELGVALVQQLGENDRVEILPAAAQLPSVTSVGMAGLLPEAGSRLILSKEENKVVPYLGDDKIVSVKQRMDVLRRKYGQRFDEMKLADFIKPRKKIAPDVDLLVIRSVEIDAYLETDPEMSLRLIQEALKRVRVAIHKLKGIGFHEAVIATDHGFFLNSHIAAGDVCTKPGGDWTFVHDRLALGSGTSDNANVVFPAAHLGIRGEAFEKVAAPRSLVPYRAGELYFHGGISLQECLVPVILIRLSSEPPRQEKVTIQLSYKDGARQVTTRFPVIDVTFEKKQMDLFGKDSGIELLLEAHDKDSQVVGEAKAGGLVNPATGTIAIQPGERLKVAMKMQEEYHGKFMIKAMNPSTFAIYSRLDLKTDYVV